MTSNFPLTPERETFDAFNEKENLCGVYTEIMINVPPSEVRSTFLDFDRKPKWDPFLIKMEVAKGNVDQDWDPSSSLPQPAISVTLDQNMDGKRVFKLPMNLSVSHNEKDKFVFGCNIHICAWVLFKAEHAHFFLPGDDKETTTKFVQYERFQVPTKKLVDLETMYKAYNISNEGLKKLCEEKNS